MAEPTTPPEEPKVPPTKEELHTIRVNHKDVQLPYAEILRRAQLGTTGEALQASKDTFKQEKTDYKAVSEFMELARANPAAAKQLDDIRTALLTGQPIPEGTAPDPAEGAGDRGDPPPQTSVDPESIRLAQKVNALEARFAKQDRTTALSAQRTMVDGLIAADEALAGSTEAAETADALATGFMASDKDLNAEDAVALAVNRVRETAVSIATKKHHTRRDLQQRFPNSPGEAGTPRLSSSEEPNTAKDVESGTVRKRAGAALDKLFLRGSGS